MRSKYRKRIKKHKIVNRKPKYIVEKPYTDVEAPKGEFGVFLVTARPSTTVKNKKSNGRSSSVIFFLC